MRFLISLSLKYIRRQKLRSSLTFLCITLSVFILNVFGAMLSSLLATLRADEIQQNGSWEVNIQSLMMDVAMRDGKTEQEVGKLISDLPVVSDYLYCNNMRLEATQVRNMENAVGYFEIQIDDQQPHRFDDLRMYQSGGNSELLGGQSYYYADGASVQLLQENEAILPDWVQEMGYEVGDTVTLTCTPVYAILSDDIPQVQATRQLIAEINDNDEGKFYGVLDDPDGGEKHDPDKHDDIYRQHLMGYIKESYTLDEIEFRDTQKGEPASVTMTIAGFAEGVTLESGQFDLTIEWGLGNFTEAIYMPNTAMNVQWTEALSPTAQVTASLMDYYGYHERFIRIADHIPFEDGLIELLKALNVEDPELYTYHFPNAMLHGSLLALELKSFDVSDGFVLGCGLAAVLLIIIWAFGRFVIDNAFEISVQERSIQFASLRVMGASKRQLTALVMTEATAYALTAVPIGTLTAVGLCKLMMTVMRGAGMRAFTFELNPWLLLLAIVLSLVAIYISAYTSAIYASRKMTLTEAMQFGKPKTAKKRKASRLKLSGKAFCYRYAWKNIMRTKRRFLISSIAMILGVALSTICLIFVIFIGLAFAVESFLYPGEDAYDFWLDSTSTSISGYNTLVEYFEDNENYSAYTIDAGSSSGLSGESQALLDKMTQADPEVGYMTIRIVHESIYTQHLEPLTGMTYAQWCDSKKALVVEDCYPDGKYDEKRNPIEPLPAGYQPVSAFTDAENPVISLTSYANESNTDIPLLGYVCPLPESQNLGLDVYGAIVVLPMENYYLYLDNMWCQAQATASPHASYDDIMEEIDALTAGGEVLLFMDEYAYNTGATKMLAAVLIAMFCFAGSIWLAGVLSMVNTLHTSVLNRRSELRMLRAVGCSTKQMKKILVLEGVVFSSVSTLIGLLLGAWFSMNLGILLEELGVIGTGIIIVVVGAILFGINQVIAVLCAKPGIKALKQDVT